MSCRFNGLSGLRRLRHKYIEAVPETLLTQRFPGIIRPTANDKDFSLPLEMTIRESLISASD